MTYATDAVPEVTVEHSRNSLFVMRTYDISSGTPGRGAHRHIPGYGPDEGSDIQG